MLLYPIQELPLKIQVAEVGLFYFFIPLFKKCFLGLLSLLQFYWAILSVEGLAFLFAEIFNFL